MLTITLRWDILFSVCSCSYNLTILVLTVWAIVMGKTGLLLVFFKLKLLAFKRSTYYHAGFFFLLGEVSAESQKVFFFFWVKSQQKARKCF